MSKLLKRPTNPKCGQDSNQTPTKLGKTRTLEDGMLQYKNPVTGNWQNAVYLQDIRQKILDQADPANYTYKKPDGNRDGKDPTNVTSYVPADKDLGPERDNRADILFKIHPTNTHSQSPVDYMKDDGRIVLDSHNHGIRGFPATELPLILSSELEGVDIELYQRRNRDIKDYDLQARMPNGYYKDKDAFKFHPGPPRKGTINQRAQRFRTKAGCIMWGQREGTNRKNAKILSYLPESCKDPTVNSTKTFRDLDKAEQAQVEAQNKGKKKWSKLVQKKTDGEKKVQQADTGGTVGIDDEDEADQTHEGVEMSGGMQNVIPYIIEEAPRSVVPSKRKASPDLDTGTREVATSFKSAKISNESTCKTSHHSSSKSRSVQAGSAGPSSSNTSQLLAPSAQDDARQEYHSYVPVHDEQHETGFHAAYSVGDYRYKALNGYTTAMYGKASDAVRDIAGAANISRQNFSGKSGRYSPTYPGSQGSYYTEHHRIDQYISPYWEGTGLVPQPYHLPAQNQGSGELDSQHSRDVTFEEALRDWHASENLSKREVNTAFEAKHQT